MNDDMQKVTDVLVTMASQLMEVADQLQSINIKYYESEDGKKTSESKKSITLEEVRGILAEKSRAGYTAEIRGLLKKYGADKLSAIKAENYEALLADAEEIGNA